MAFPNNFSHKGVGENNKLNPRIFFMEKKIQMGLFSVFDFFFCQTQPKESVVKNLDTV